jgi:hypothetical protein
MHVVYCRRQWVFLPYSRCPRILTNEILKWLLIVGHLSGSGSGSSAGSSSAFLRASILDIAHDAKAIAACCRWRTKRIWSLLPRVSYCLSPAIWKSGVDNTIFVEVCKNSSSDKVCNIESLE